MPANKGSNGASLEKQQRLKTRDLLFAALILILGAAHIIVMLQSVGIIRADR